MTTETNTTGGIRAMAFDLMLWAGAALLLYALLSRGAPVLILVSFGAVLLFAGIWGRRRLGPVSGIVGKVLLLTGSVAFSLLLLEGGARMILGEQPLAHADYFERHPEAIYTLKPDTHLVYDRRQVEFRDFDLMAVDISAQGVRDRMIGPKEADEFRVLVLGDSFSFGYALAAEETISAQLERLLGAALAGRKVTVINGGVEGYGPWQERIFLNERGFPLEPDLVILATFPTNDLYDSLVQVGKYFRAYHEGSLERTHAFRHLDLWPFRWQRWLRKHSRVYQFAVQQTERENLFADAAGQLRFAPVVPTLDLPPREDRNYKLETSLREWYAEVDEAWDLYRREVLGIRADCAARDVDFMAVCVPALHVIYDKYWDEFVQPAGAAAYERGKEVRVVEEFFQAEGIPFAPVTEALNAHADPLDVYFKFNKHLTPTGVEVVATALRDVVLKEDFAP